MGSEMCIRDRIGEDALPALFEECAQRTLSETLDAVIDRIERFRNGAEPQDDIILLGFEVR